MAANNNVRLIYSEPEEQYARETIDFLVSHEFKHIINNTGYSEFSSPRSLPVNSAIIFLSDGALSDPEWQEKVIAVPDEYRVIPIRGKGSIDYSKKEDVVARLREINYIKPADNYLDDIIDSLYTSPAFYSIRNEVIIMANAWNMSDRQDTYLMANWKKNRQYIKIYSDVIQREQNPVIKQKLGEEQEYLKISSARSKAYFFQDLRKYYRIVLCAIVGIIITIAMLSIRKKVKYATFAKDFLGYTAANQLPSFAAINLVEGLKNPYVPSSTKNYFFQDLVPLLNRNWDNTPLGFGLYKWRLYDTLVEPDKRYIITANGNGQAVLWDSYTGEIIKRENVSANPLASIDRAETGTRFAIDSIGDIFISESDDSWINTNTRCNVTFTDGLKIRTTKNGKRIVVNDPTHCFLFDNTNNTLTLIWEKNYDMVYACDIDDQGNVLLAVNTGDKNLLLSCTDSENTQYDFPFSLNDICYPSIQGKRIVFADNNGNIYYWDTSLQTAPDKTGLILTNPIALCLSDSNYLAYHDRNEGTRIYDLDSKIILADCIEYQNRISKLDIQNNILIAYNDYNIFSEDLTNIFPTYAIPEPEIRTYSSTKDTDSGKVIHSISVENDYIIRLDVCAPDEHTIILDSSTRYFIGNAQRDESLLDGIPEDYSYYLTLNVHFTGKPTVTGIIPDTDVIVIASEDGSFYEVKISKDGGAMITSETQIPSHLPIVSIHQTENAYYLEDSVGNFWRARIGYYAALNEDLLYKEIREKIHRSMPSTLMKELSPEVSELLELHEMTIPDDKEWE